MGSFQSDLLKCDRDCLTNGFKEDVPVSNGSVFVGVDIGSTTAKLVIRDGEEIIYKKYERHYSQVRLKTLTMLEDAKEYLADKEIKIAISGSAGLGVAEAAGINFVQDSFHGRGHQCTR
jgi:activator of 2-hydroxyglutaryl-CoA dehydratase